MSIATVNESVSGPKLTADQQVRQKAMDVARQFEEIFAKQMVAEMQKSSMTGEGGGLFGKGAGSSTYSSWFEQQLATKLTSGRGLGVGNSVMRFLERSPQVKTEAEAFPEPKNSQGAKIDVDA